MKRVLYCGAAMAVATSAAASADERTIPGSLSVSVGYDVSQSDTDVGSDDAIDVVTLAARLALGDWSFGLSTGYVDLSDDPNSVFVGPRGQEFEVISGQAASGFTDLVLSAGYALADETDSRPGVYVSSAVKVPTADEEAGLSSGAVDVSGSVELFKSFDRVTAYAYAGGRIRGDSDDDVAERRFRFQRDGDDADPDDPAPEQQNAFEGGFGLQIPFGANWTASLGYDYRGASFKGGEAIQEITALVSVAPTSLTTVSAYVYQPIANDEASVGAGVYVSQKLLKW